MGVVPITMPPLPFDAAVSRPSAPTVALRFVYAPAVTPLAGNPVALVSTIADGVPSAGVTRVGDVAKTGAPEPVTALARPAATPVPNPLTPVEMGRPVALVSVADVGVPS